MKNSEKILKDTQLKNVNRLSELNLNKIFIVA